MHIEPSIVDGAKIGLSYGTAAAALGLTIKQSFEHIKEHGLTALTAKSLMTTALVFFFFEVLPHHPVGVSEVHFILGSTLFLLFGAAPTAIGLSAGLLIQGVFLAPIDLPQYGMNVTTLLVPLWALKPLANSIIPKHVAYKDLSYGQTLKLSLAYQGGVIGWVSFWVFYGQGIGQENLSQVLSFGGAYATVIVFEPLVDMGVLSMAKLMDRYSKSPFIERRLFFPAS